MSATSVKGFAWAWHLAARQWPFVLSVRILFFLEPSLLPLHPGHLASKSHSGFPWLSPSLRLPASPLTERPLGMGTGA